MNVSRLKGAWSRIRARAWLAAVALAWVVSAHGGPLGLEMGAPLKDLRARIRLTPEGHHEYSAKSLPGGHPDFAAYRLLISPVHGLCKITAWTRPVRTGPQGNEIRQRFETLREALTGRYGAGRRYDLLREESLWRDPRDWMVAMHSRDRDLYARWTDEYVELEAYVSAVHLRVNTLGPSKASLQLGYEFRNTNECVHWLKERQDRKL